jgi:hypothetical protein
VAGHINFVGMQNDNPPLIRPRLFLLFELCSLNEGQSLPEIRPIGALCGRCPFFITAMRSCHKYSLFWQTPCPTSMVPTQ